MRATRFGECDRKDDLIWDLLLTSLQHFLCDQGPRRRLEAGPALRRLVVLRGREAGEARGEVRRATSACFSIPSIKSPKLLVLRQGKKNWEKG
jgi:hypothetical protein